jgi:hypothetical protein
MNCCPCFSHLLSDLGEIRYKKCAHSLLSVFKFCESAQGRPYFSYRRKSNYIYACTVKPYDILEVQNVMVKSVFCISDYTMQAYILVETLIFSKGKQLFNPLLLPVFVKSAALTF